MGEQGNRQIVERYIRALPADFETLERLRHEDFVEEWPQSGERIRGHANYRAIHERYPGGAPRIEPRELVGSEDHWVVTPMLTPLRVMGAGDSYTAEFAAVYPGGGSYHIVAVIELRDGRVLGQRTYFAPPFEAPDWRSAWVEREPQHAQEVSGMETSTVSPDAAADPIGPFVGTLTWTTFADPRAQWVDEDGVEHVRGQVSTGEVTGDMEAAASNDFNSDQDPRTGAGAVFGSYTFATAEETWTGHFAGTSGPDGSAGTWDGLSDRNRKLAGTFEEIAEGSYRCEWFLLGLRGELAARA